MTRRRFIAIVAPPLGAFVVSRLVLSAAAWRLGLHPFDPDTWARGDSIHYLSIARGGYDLFRCEGVAGFEPDEWCGNAGWMPLYPALLAPFALAGVSAAAGVAIAGALHFATLVVLWAGFLEARLTPSRALVLLTAAFFPGQVYDHAIFPLSLLSLLVLLAVRLLLDGRHATAAVAMGVAAVAYPAGMLLLPAAAVWLFLRGEGPLGRRVARAASPAGAGAVALAAFALAQRLETGAWDAFLRVQAKYGHGLANPLRILREAQEETASFLHHPDIDLAPGVQTLFVAGLVVLLTFAVVVARQRSPEALLLSSFLVGAWLFPLVVGGLNLYRAEAVLLPGVVLARLLPWPLQALILAVAAPLSFLIGTLFFQSVLV